MEGAENSKNSFISLSHTKQQHSNHVHHCAQNRWVATQQSADVTRKWRSMRELRASQSLNLNSDVGDGAGLVDALHDAGDDLVGPNLVALLQALA